MSVVAVMGSGLMGAGIAQAAASAGHYVHIIDIADEQLDKARALIGKLIGGKVAKGKMTQDEADTLLERLSYTTNYEVLRDAEIVVEAVPEKMAVKQETFSRVSSFVGPTCLLLTNTSGINIDAIAEAVSHKDRLLGAHFFYPAPVMKLVELIRGTQTSDEAFNQAQVFAQSLGKTTVVAPNQPGFIVNRLIVPYQNEGAYLVSEGCTPQDVDTAMKLGCNHPMGPCELMDFTGIDVVYATMKGLYEAFGDEKYRPCPLLKEMIEAGTLGRKTGKGFYTYE